MIKVRDQKGNALFANSFYPTQSDSLAGLNMKKLSPGAYTVTAQLNYNGTVASASQKYQITKPGSGDFGTPTPTATATVSRTSTPTSTSSRTAIATATSTRTATPIINCPSGFASSGSCGVSLTGSGGQPFQFTFAQGTGVLSGTQAELIT